MRIGLTYDLKESIAWHPGVPDDALEEYDSIETVEAIDCALGSRGHSVVRLGGGREFLSSIIKEKVEMVFNIAEGLGNGRSREAQVPSVLEMLDIPYTGSDPQCLAICLDKPLAKRLAESAGIPTPNWKLVRTVNEVAQIDWTGFAFPAFVKPAWEGSSKGVRFSSCVGSAEQIEDMIAGLTGSYGQPVLVEEFIPGDEVTVGIVGNALPSFLGIMRVLPRDGKPDFIYSIEVKREWENRVTYECPARLCPATLVAITRASLAAYRVLGCRDFARIDFRVAKDGTPWFLEANPLAGLNPVSSDLPIMAGMLGIEYGQLIHSIVAAARERYPLCVAP